MAKTWEVTPVWNKALRAELATRFPGWRVFGGEYLSWVWVRRRRRPILLYVFLSSFLARAPEIGKHIHRPTTKHRTAHSSKVDTGSADATNRAVQLASAVGTPVRSAGPGYNMPTFFRIAVREPGVTKVGGWNP